MLRWHAQLDFVRARQRELFVELAACDASSHGTGGAQAAARLYDSEQRWDAAVALRLRLAALAALKWLALALALVLITGCVVFA